jgi:hypothetical protein
MRGTGSIAGAVLVAAALMLGACGGSPPPEDEWAPSRRALNVSDRWWWGAYEVYCEEDEDCPTAGDSCRSVRLGTCPNCPRGEDTGVCFSPDGEMRQQPPQPDSK